MHETKPNDLENTSSGVSSYFSVSVTVQHDWQHDFLLSSGDESAPFLYTCRLSAHATNEWQTQTSALWLLHQLLIIFDAAFAALLNGNLHASHRRWVSPAVEVQDASINVAKAAALSSIIEKVPPLRASPWNVRSHVSGCFMHGQQVGPCEHQNRSNKGHKKTKTRGGKRQVGGTEQHANAKTTPTERQHYMDKQAVLCVCQCGSVNMKDLSV